METNAHSYIVFDIETGSLPMDRLREILPAFDPANVPHPGTFEPKSIKVGNLKDQAKIDAKIDDARIAHDKSVRNYASDLVSAEFVYWQEQKNKAALSAMTGRVVAIGFTDINGVAFADCINDPDSDELTLLCKFWDLYESCRDTRLNMVGFNSDDFDLPFLCQRSIVLGCKPPSTVIQNKRFLDSCFVDLRKLWGFGKLNPSGSLDAICRACGIGSKPQGIDGSQFSDLYFNPETREQAIAYLFNDLKMTHALAQRLIGSSDNDYGSSSLESS